MFPKQGFYLPTSDKTGGEARRTRSGAFSWLELLIAFLCASWAVYHVQFGILPSPRDADNAVAGGFSEISAREHVKHLTNLGPHPVGTDALDLAVQYVYEAAEEVKDTAHEMVDVHVEFFHADTGANREIGGNFEGKTHLYSDLKHVVVRIVPKDSPGAEKNLSFLREEAEKNLILLSCHIDTVFSAVGAGDDSSSVAVMLELARGVSQQAHGFKSGVLFLFNTGEEEGLNGAHSFITQHPWASSIRLAIDLEAMGIGGKSTIFQVTKLSALQNYAAVSKYPSAQIISQDIFQSGVINSATDFQIYKNAGLSGLDFAYTDRTAVYHTKNDKLELLKPGSLQQLGEDMLAFLITTASSSEFLKDSGHGEEQDNDENKAIYFDILGKYMVVYPLRLGIMIHYSVIFLSLLILAISLLMSGYSGILSFGISCLSLVLMWIFAIILALLVIPVLLVTSSFPIPYIANPWLVVGLFGAPALLGAFIGQHIGFLLLKKYNIELEAERWLFKAGFVQWLIILIIGTYFEVGSSYIALIWLVSPACAYGLMETTPCPARPPTQLKVTTLFLGLAAPVISTVGVFIRLVETVVGNIPRLDKNPGSIPDWKGNLIAAIVVALVVGLMFVYLLSYAHASGAQGPLVVLLSMLFVLTVALVSFGIVPAFTNDVARAVNVVHVVDATEIYDENKEPLSYVSLFSTTPGKFTKELANLQDEEFVCGSSKTVDFTTFTMEYGCLSYKEANIGWSKSEVPILHVENDSMGDTRKTVVSVDTKLSTRWALAINAQEIRDFTVQVNSQELVPADDKSVSNGWRIIQFAGGQDSPTKFQITLFWSSNTADPSLKRAKEADSIPLLLKLRTDMSRITPAAGRVLQKLPSWCSLYGKSTWSKTLSFLTALPVQFSGTRIASA